LAATLGEMGADARPAIAALQKALDDLSPPVRLAAASALGQIEGNGKAGMRIVADALESREAVVRRHAVEALAGLAQEADTPKLLTTAMKDADADVRRAAARCAGRLGAMAKLCVSALADLLLDADDAVGREAVVAVQALVKKDV